VEDSTRSEDLKGTLDSNPPEAVDLILTRPVTARFLDF